MKALLIASFLLLALLVFGCGAREPAAPQAPELLPVVTTPQNATPPELSLIVQTDAGLVSGMSEDSVKTYLGIPYAAPPVGELRWKTPQQVESWAGVRNATDFGAPCTQTLGSFLQAGEVKNQTSEDCLYLNVWTPAQSADEKLPVMVWIHGGSFTTGSGSTKDYYGKELAKKGVVVVNINYRLGPFGFFVHPELAAESPNNVSGNYGLLDQVAALQWVKRNIAAFGGDPEQVTIFGESAGSLSVSAHILSPLSKGLFSKAVMESGTIFTLRSALSTGNVSVAGAESISRAYAEALGCPEPGQIACLRSKSAEELENATNGEVLFEPVFDGWFFPGLPSVILAEGPQKEVPIMIGFNQDEGTIFENTAEEQAALKKTAFVIPSILVADAMSSNVYFYKFTRVPPTKAGTRFGCYHSAEIDYVFGTLEAGQGYGEEDFALSAKMMSYWTNFAKTGNPNAEGLPSWPLYDKQKREYIVLDLNVTVRSGMSEDD